MNVVVNALDAAGASLSTAEISPAFFTSKGGFTISCDPTGATLTTKRALCGTGPVAWALFGRGVNPSASGGGVRSGLADFPLMSAVPAAASAALFLSGVAGLAPLRRRSRAA
jgi:hypothetical protein